LKDFFIAAMALPFIDDIKTHIIYAIPFWRVCVASLMRGQLTRDNIVHHKHHHNGMKFIVVVLCEEENSICILI
jgi:hypothetical protein